MRQDVSETGLLLRYRLWMALFVVGLVASGVTAFPLLHELRWVVRVAGIDASGVSSHGAAAAWIFQVWQGLEDVYARYPWIAYGTDWLAFGHLMIALFFVHPFVHPRGSRPVLLTGLAACALVVPLAFVCGSIRGIPVFWRFLDCSFGLFGSVPLLVCLSLESRMRKETATSPA